MSFWDEKRRFSPETRQSTLSGGIHRGLVDQQNRNVVPDRVNPPTLVTLEDFRVHLQYQRLLANGAYQDVEQVL